MGGVDCHKVRTYLVFEYKTTKKQKQKLKFEFLRVIIQFHFVFYSLNGQTQNSTSSIIEV